MAHPRYIRAIVVAITLSLLLVGCRQPAPAPVPSPLDDLEASVKTEVERQVGRFLDADLRHYEVSASRLQGDGKFGHVEVQVVLEGCPLFRYDLFYNAELKDGQWVLYNDEDTLVNLFKLWAMSHSAALGGETVDVPGSEGRHHVHLVPDRLPELLRSRLDGPGSPAAEALVGFFVCQEDEVRWEELDQGVAEDLRELIPQAREAMDEGIVAQIGSE